MRIEAMDPTTALDDAIKSIGAAERVVICGPPNEAEALKLQLAAATSTPDESIAASMTIDIDAWFEEQRQEFEEEWEEELADSEGEWPGESPHKQAFTGASEVLSGKPYEKLMGVFIPVDRSWKIPAHLQFGGWNECPDPEIQCAVWRYWEAKYGAAIISVSCDVVEAYVPNPPTTVAEAMALAWEQYLYCNDIVDQGTETIANLAAGIINHNLWYFWWD